MGAPPSTAGLSHASNFCLNRAVPFVASNIAVCVDCLSWVAAGNLFLPADYLLQKELTVSNQLTVVARC